LGEVGLEDVTVCPVCEGKYFAEYRTVTSSPTMYIEFCGGAIQVCTVTQYIRCEECGLIIQSPRMTQERIDRYYSSGLYRSTLGIAPDVMDRDERRRAEHLTAFLFRHNILFKTHIDIGASKGHFITRTREVFGSAGYGIDRAGNIGEGMDRAELVSAIHVLEHDPNPVDALKWYAGMTTKYLLLEVPGVTCPGAPLRFAHLFAFTPDVIRRMVADIGFTILVMEEETNIRVLLLRGDVIQ
jgi:hypothetical protein